jgi:hypothetical protein
LEEGATQQKMRARPQSTRAQRIVHQNAKDVQNRGHHPGVYLVTNVTADGGCCKRGNLGHQLA